MHVLALIAVLWLVCWRIQAARQARAIALIQLAILAELERIGEP